MLTLHTTQDSTRNLRSQINTHIHADSTSHINMHIHKRLHNHVTLTGNIRINAVQGPATYYVYRKFGLAQVGSGEATDSVIVMKMKQEMI